MKEFLFYFVFERMIMEVNDEEKYEGTFKLVSLCPEGRM